MSLKLSRTEHARPIIRWVIEKILLPVTVCGSVLTCAAQTSAPAVKRLPVMARQVLSWLPEDTETILVVERPFTIPPPSPDNDRQIREKSPDKIFEMLPLGLFGLKESLLQKYLIGETVEFALEGSRHFRSPSALGEALYEGCQIVVLKNASPERGASFRTRAAKAALKGEIIAGQDVSVFQEKLEEDTWTTFVAFPRPNLVMACTDSDYLREVIERVGGKVGKRALPDTLAEWNFVHTDASFWGLRHFDKSQADRDPTSPFADSDVLEISDKQAVGIAVAFDSGNQNTARISYFSGVTDILDFLQKRTPLSMEVPGLVPSTANLPIHYRQTAPGVAAIEYELGDKIPAEAFIFVMLAVFGHPIYL
jgi:hypothetical protein